MKAIILLSIPLALLPAFGAGVAFWAAVSQVRFLAFFRNRDDRPPPLGVSGWLRFYRDTLLGAYRLLWWAMRAAFQAGLRMPRPEIGRPVLCIHGLFMNSTSLWGIRRHLERLGRPTRGVFLGVPLPTPMRYLGPLTRVVEEMADRSGEDGFDIVAHSIGGVLTRELLRREPHLATKIRTIVTLGSPHRGTAALRLVRFGPIYRMLGRDSSYLADLPDLRTVAPATVTVTVASHHDLVVYPVALAQLDGSRKVTLEAVSHLGLLTDRRAWVTVEEALTVR